MKKILVFCVVLSSVVWGKDFDFNQQADYFFKGLDLKPQNLPITSLEEALAVKGFLFFIEVLNVEINDGHIDTLVLNDGDELYQEFTNYTKQYGRSSLNPAFLTYMGLLEMRLMPFQTRTKKKYLSERSRTHMNAALEKESGYIPALLGLAQWYLITPTPLGGGVGPAEDYLLKAWRYAQLPVEKYQISVWRAWLYKKDNKLELAEKELNNAANIYPNGKFHAYVQKNKM